MSAVEINYSFEYAPTLWKFYNCDKRIIAVRGARGSGKSSVCVMKLIKNGLAQTPDPKDGIRRSRWAIVRNTNAQLFDSSIRKVFEWFPEEYFGTFNKTEKNYKITRFDKTEIEFSFRALDKPKDVRNLLSLELSGAWLNEAREIPKIIFDNIDASLGRFPSQKDGGCTLPQILLDSNSPEENSWWYNYFEIDRPKNKEIQNKSEQFVQPSGRSPEAENIPFLIPGYYEDLIAGKDLDWIKVYIDNEYGFVREGDPIYAGKYADHLHAAKNTLRAITGRNLIAAFDFGLTPTAVIGQITPRGYFNILEEFVSEDMGIERFANNILRPLFATKYYGFDVTITGDPSGKQRSQTDEKTCYEILMNIFPGFKIQPASTNSPVARIGAVEYFLSNYIDPGIPCLQISPECKILRKAFSAGYVKDKLGNPKKNSYSHIADAMGYAALLVSEDVSRLKRTSRIIKRPPYTPPSHIGL